MDLDKIIKGLDICSQENTCNGCPYAGKDGCASTMKNNAIAAIKELRAKAENPKASGALNGMINEATGKKIDELRREVDAQAQAIVEMTLGRLTGLEREKIEEELNKLHNLIAELREILADEAKLRQIIKDEMLEIKRKYGDERRTEICEAQSEIIYEDLIERHSCVITLTHTGYIKRLPADTYTAQHRGGKGITGMTTREGDIVENMFTCCSHDYILLFSNLGRLYRMKAYEIPEGSRSSSC